VGIRCADHVTPPNPQNLALTLPTGGGRCVGIVRSRTKATEECFSEGKILGEGWSGMEVITANIQAECMLKHRYLFDTDPLRP